MKLNNRIPTRQIALNTEHDGTCRTLKANYFKTGRINFQYKNDWGATGVTAIYDTI